MSAAALLKPVASAVLIALLPVAASAQSPTPSERAMPDAKTDAKPAPSDAKSERALPTQTKEAAPAPATAERAMPAKEK